MVCLKKLLSSFFVFISISFCSIFSLEVNVEQGNSNTAIVKEQQKDLALKIKFLYDQILNQDYMDLEDRILVNKLKYNIDYKFSDFRYNQFLLNLIESQKVANAKIDILKTINNLSGKNDLNFSKIKLYVLNCLYEKLESNINSNKKILNNKFITDLVFKFSGLSYFSFKKYNLLSFDFYNLYTNLYEKYSNFIDNPLISELSVFENLLNDLIKEKNSLNIKEKEKIFLFDLFILNVLKIKEDIEKTRSFIKKFSSLDPKKKSIFIRNLVITQGQDFNDLLKSKVFGYYFSSYKSLVDDFLNNDKLDKDLFTYKLTLAISELRKAKIKFEPQDFVSKLIHFRSEQNVQAEIAINMISELVAVLESILNSFFVDQDGLLKDDQGFILKLLNGQLTIPDKVKDIVSVFIKKD